MVHGCRCWRWRRAAWSYCRFPAFGSISILARQLIRCASRSGLSWSRPRRPRVAGTADAGLHGSGRRGKEDLGGHLPAEVCKTVGRLGLGGGRSGDRAGNSWGGWVQPCGLIGEKPLQAAVLPAATVRWRHPAPRFGLAFICLLGPLWASPSMRFCPFRFSRSHGSRLPDRRSAISAGFRARSRVGFTSNRLAWLLARATGKQNAGDAVSSRSRAGAGHQPGRFEAAWGLSWRGCGGRRPRGRGWAWREDALVSPSWPRARASARFWVVRLV